MVDSCHRAKPSGKKPDVSKPPAIPKGRKGLDQILQETGGYATSAPPSIPATRDLSQDKDKLQRLHEFGCRGVSGAHGLKASKFATANLPPSLARASSEPRRVRFAGVGDRPNSARSDASGHGATGLDKEQKGMFQSIVSEIRGKQRDLNHVEDALTDLTERASRVGPEYAADRRLVRKELAERSKERVQLK